ncbi:alpha/beta fold hydrolase [archaeon]|nr:MAG: alpha/beta fold hydrolase [archaeon]
MDWPGMGCSTRNTVQMKKLDWMCSLPAKLHSKKNPASNYAMFLARQVTDEFIDSLEDLRQEEQLTEFVLAGHSLGGFLAAKYALKYPTHLSGLVLISPVGVPFPPPREEHITTSQLDWRIRVLKNLWELNFTPQAIVRVAGSRGPELVKNAIDRRFAKQWEKEELQLLSDYLYQITVLPAQGEYSLNTLLEPVFVRSTNPQARRSYRSGVYAKEPLEQDLCKLGKIPLLLVYGDDDWLYYSTVAETIQLWKKNNVDAELMMVSRAGHHLYTDNAREFNAGVLDWVKRKALL